MSRSVVPMSLWGEILRARSPHYWGRLASASVRCGRRSPIVAVGYERPRKPTDVDPKAVAALRRRNEQAESDQ